MGIQGVVKSPQGNSLERGKRVTEAPHLPSLQGKILVKGQVSWAGYIRQKRLYPSFLLPIQLSLPCFFLFPLHFPGRPSLGWRATSSCLHFSFIDSPLSIDGRKNHISSLDGIIRRYKYNLFG
jgi:hypothetical protein